MVQDREIPESAFSGKVCQIEYGWQTHHESFVCSSLCYLAPHRSVSPLAAVSVWWRSCGETRAVAPAFEFIGKQGLASPCQMPALGEIAQLVQLHLVDARKQCCDVLPYIEDCRHRRLLVYRSCGFRAF